MNETPRAVGEGPESGGVGGPHTSMALHQRFPANIQELILAVRIDDDAEMESLIKELWNDVGKLDRYKSASKQLTLTPGLTKFVQASALFYGSVRQGRAGQIL